ncbi:MAG: endonuclease MutS2 [Candidatus Latescibacterota bacterium]
MTDAHTLAVLEFDKVREIVSGYTISVPGRERVAALAPLDDGEKLQQELNRVAECLDLVSFGDPLPIRGIRDIRSALARCAAEGAMLEPKDFLDLSDTLEVIRKLAAYFASHREKYPLLSRLAGDLEGHPEVEEAIARVVDPGGEVKDSASKALRHIRRDIEARRQSLRNELEAYLRKLPDQVVQDRLVTLRNGRYVIPIQENQRGRVEGIVHDQSASGATVFVEPLTTLERNNQIRQLELAEQREIGRILVALTAEIRTIRERLMTGMRILSELDVLHAKASYGADYEAIAPQLNAQGSTQIIQGRHPLLCVRYRQEGHEDAVMPLDIEVGAAFDTLLITGPNAGGKTVALKTVGLLTVMALSGLPIPAGEKTEIALVRRICADIGDEQSIENDLSTFSSRVQRLADICRNADSDTLVLLDEIGSSTDPDEGSALAMAALEHLTGRGARTIATTHHGRLKAFAHEHERVENGSMQFDRDTLRPSFRFRLGIPGSSYAFEIAERLGMPQTIIRRATEYGGADARQLEDLISELQRVQQEYETQSLILEESVSQHERLKAEYEEKVRGAEQEVRTIRAEALRESEEILSGANALVERTVAEIRSHQADRGSIVKAKTSLGKATSKVRQGQRSLAKEKKKTKPIQDVAVGDWVWADRFGGRARVLALGKASGRIQLQAGHAKVWIRPSDITKVVRDGDQGSEVRDQRPGSTYVGGNWGRSVGPSVSVRGMTLDEALPIVEQYLDDAFLASMKQVVIIHGKGTGVLREHVGTLLRQDPRVQSQRPGDWNEGGSGVTIVEMAV